MRWVHDDDVLSKNEWRWWERRPRVEGWVEVVVAFRTLRRGEGEKGSPRRLLARELSEYHASECAQIHDNDCGYTQREEASICLLWVLFCLASGRQVSDLGEKLLQLFREVADCVVSACGRVLVGLVAIRLCSQDRLQERRKQYL